ncbi:MAG: hypothetical protein K9J16_13980 [Melioribacteraceae bacterium]|nr:hypothetical protein [Melioribacteraceae bacterium]MCF8356346.1 hypothetical protein [Melioribacteraceae bacterium]MCF8395755.1 hypothetical protein [Melioribacteraceae bacterium]MCF8420557.1 hypothetical protein [Melioribacteraceae bacterium]
MELITTSGIALIQLISAIACIFIVEKRGGSPLAWFLIGLLFGPLAIIVALTAGRQCEHCKFIIPKDSTVCGHCAKTIDKPRFSIGKSALRADNL